MISQDDNEVFNRAMLFNVGFSEAVKLSEWDCLGKGGAKYVLEIYPCQLSYAIKNQINAPKAFAFRWFFMALGYVASMYGKVL